jgi:hypothetical protein
MPSGNLICRQPAKVLTPIKSEMLNCRRLNQMLCSIFLREAVLQDIGTISLAYLEGSTVL